LSASDALQTAAVVTADAGTIRSARVGERSRGHTIEQQRNKWMCRDGAEIGARYSSDPANALNPRSADGGKSSHAERPSLTAEGVATNHLERSTLNPPADKAEIVRPSV
jgi:hypothetical protein